MMALSEGSPESLTEIHQLSPRCDGCVMVTLRGRISFSSTQSTTARSGGFMYNPTMSRTLSRNNGSLDNLKVSSSHGLRPNAFQMRLIVGWDITPKYGRDSEPSRLGHQGASLEAEHSRSDHRATGWTATRRDAWDIKSSTREEFLVYCRHRAEAS